MMVFSTDAPILISLGQSNAHGHSTLLPVCERITAPLRSVYGLSRAHNQAFGLSDVVWSGFVTEGMNLGETQDHTYCLAERFARLWQQACDANAQLPPLYIIQISVGGQGIAAVERNGQNMWYPQRTPILTSGPLGTVDISLHPLATQTLRNAVQNLRHSGKTPRILGLHWNQWETEVDTGGDSIVQAEQNYTALFDSFAQALNMPYPLWLYEPLSDVYNHPQGLAAMHALFTKFAKTNAQTHLMQTTRCPDYCATAPGKGIFLDDCVHYKPSLYAWFAAQQYEACFATEQEEVSRGEL